jgi:hypothetical protein
MAFWMAGASSAKTRFALLLAPALPDQTIAAGLSLANVAETCRSYTSKPA